MGALIGIPSLGLKSEKRAWHSIFQSGTIFGHHGPAVGIVGQVYVDTFRAESLRAISKKSLGHRSCRWRYIVYDVVSE